MTITMGCFAFVAALFALWGYAPAARGTTQAAGGERPSLWEVAENLERYRGARLEFDAHFVSDGMHEEVLEDLSCDQGGKIIDIGRRGHSDSVARFYAERRRICTERGEPDLCSTSRQSRWWARST